LKKPVARARTQELMELVGIGEPARRYDDLPSNSAAACASAS
jgi:hypothetical protein